MPRHGKRVEIFVEDVDDPYTARMGTADLRKLHKLYNTTKPSDSECGYDHDYNDYNNPPIVGGLDQEIVDLHIQPIIHDVTYMLRGLVWHVVPPPIRRPRQNRVGWICPPCQRQNRLYLVHLLLLLTIHH